MLRNKKNDNESTCGCGCNENFKDKEVSQDKVLIEYLYLDLSTCERCIGTDQVLEEVIDIIRPALELAGYLVVYNKVEMKTQETAIEYEFLSSPTIRINGYDICESVEENNCDCCSDISGNDVDCRVFKYENEMYEIPPKTRIAEDILKAIFKNPSDTCKCKKEYEFPENLKSFYEGKKSI